MITPDQVKPRGSKPDRHDMELAALETLCDNAIREADDGNWPAKVIVRKRDYSATAVYETVTKYRSAGWVATSPSSSGPESTILIDRGEGLAPGPTPESVPADGPRITIGRVDVTDHVAAMYDVLVISVESGSVFLEPEEIEAIVTIGVLARFDLTSTKHPHPDSAPVEVRSVGIGESAERDRRLASWRAQLEAKARALAEDV